MEPQSYLAGIEIYKNMATKNTLLDLNRTLLELKYRKKS